MIEYNIIELWFGIQLIFAVIPFSIVLATTKEDSVGFMSVFIVLGVLFAPLALAVFFIKKGLDLWINYYKRVKKNRVAMKKRVILGDVYCKNCKYYISGGMDMCVSFSSQCHHPNNSFPKKHHYGVTKEWKVLPEDKNRGNNCEDYCKKALAKKIPPDMTLSESTRRYLKDAGIIDYINGA